ncbi:hypothetical protein DXT96_16450 [Agrobacterium sp. ICMP 6402]|uniref:hypothetical protein n=1 Tax=Agrobacterium sp. ICMP 6402 TaxID=2292443 RepID=UPI0012977D3F|nr:hypothetical protein [Agrobacterium sp. ICMP 6402]MQB11434.1 hypothetical protein [Agrobacterium sp. ICMP 6402]
MKSKLQIATVFVCALALFGLAIWMLVTFRNAFIAADKSVQAAIIAGSVGLFSVALTFWKERSRSIKEAHRDKKIEVYSKFYDLMFGLLKHQSSGEEIDPLGSGFQEQWFEVSRGVLFYGSPAVVKAFSEFKADPPDGASADPRSIFRRIGKILLAMRDDIGLSNFGLDELNIHQIYVRDDINKIGQVQ